MSAPPPSVPVLIQGIMDLMVNAHKAGMPDDQLFSAAITAITALAKAAGHSDILPLVLDQAIRSIVMEDISATRH